jgi:putative transposase
MIFFSERSLRRAVGQYVEHFHHERNHQGLDNLIPFPNSPESQSECGLIVKSERLGGLLNYYHREEMEVREAA